MRRQVLAQIVGQIDRDQVAQAPVDLEEVQAMAVGGDLVGQILRGDCQAARLDVHVGFLSMVAGAGGAARR